MRRARIHGRAGDRDARAAAVMAGALAEAAPSGRLLVVDDDDGAVEAAAARFGPAEAWRRGAHAGRAARAWPPDGPFDGATIRIPRAWPAFEMILHAVATRVAPRGPIWVYGANDEGARSVGRRMEPILGEARTVDTRRHCRVVVAERPARPPVPLRGELEAWREAVTIDLPRGPGTLELVSYPGVFAHGRLDEGTARLLEALPPIPAGARVLDFGCGAGVIAAVLRRRQPDVALTLCDVDAVAAHAARQNVPGARVHLGDGFDAVPADATFDLILSNPPIHAGRDEDFRILRALLEEAPARLTAGGALVFVVQRTVGAGRLAADGFARAERLHEDTRFQVWRCER